MKLLLGTATLAMALLFGGAFSNPALAQGNGRWCLHAPDAVKVNCGYDTLARCEKYEDPTNGWCSLNKQFIARAKARAKHATTGAGMRK